MKSEQGQGQGQGEFIQYRDQPGNTTRHSAREEGGGESRVSQHNYSASKEKAGSDDHSCLRHALKSPARMPRSKKEWQA